MIGYIYIFSNKAIPNLYKIGCTSRSPYERANELYTTGVPHPFTVEYYIKVDNYDISEKNIHKILSNYRESKEWFNCDLATCISVIKKYHNDYRIYDEFCKENILLKTSNNDFKIHIKQNNIYNIDNEKKYIYDNSYKEFCNKMLKNSSFRLKIFLLSFGLIYTILLIIMIHDIKRFDFGLLLLFLPSLFFIVIPLISRDETYYDIKDTKEEERLKKEYEKIKYK